MAHQLLVLLEAVHGDEGQVEEAAHVELRKVALLLVVQAAHVVHDGAHAGVHLQDRLSSCHTERYYHDRVPRLHAQ